jgi:hypothetical protein
MHKKCYWLTAMRLLIDCEVRTESASSLRKTIDCEQRLSLVVGRRTNALHHETPSSPVENVLGSFTMWKDPRLRNAAACVPEIEPSFRPGRWEESDVWIVRRNVRPRASTPIHCSTENTAKIPK